MDKMEKGIARQLVGNWALCFDQWHSSPASIPLYSLGLLSTWLISSTCSWVDGSCPEQERADKFSSVSSFPRPLLSPDTAYEVNFTLSSLILAPLSRCLCHILRPRRAPLPAGRARSLPRNAHHSRPFRSWSEPPSIKICQNVAPL